MKLALLFCLLAAAAAQDLRSGRISNRLIAAGLTVGLAMKLAEYRAWGLYFYLRNISVPVILLFLLFRMRVLGAGDIKLFSMIGGILTVRELFRCMLFGLAAGGVMAFFCLLADRDWRMRLRYAAGYLIETARSGRIEPYRPPAGAGNPGMAFAFPIFIGTLAALYFPGR